MTRVAILISGGGSNMLRLLSELATNNTGQAALVLSNVPDAAGLAKAHDRSVPTLCINHKDFAHRGDFDAAVLACLRQHQIDVICLAGFMRILSPDFVAEYSDRMLNIHPSLLPKFRGLDTHRRALDAGEVEHGCSVHLVTPELDDGPILGQARVPILPGDDAKTLAARVLKQEHRLYPAVLRRFLDGDRTPIFWP